MLPSSSLESVRTTGTSGSPYMSWTLLGTPLDFTLVRTFHQSRKKVEKLTSALAKVIKSQLGDINVFARKDEGVVTIDFQPCACIQLADDRTAVLQWNSAVCDAFSLDREKAKCAFYAGRKGIPTAWSSS